MYQSNMSYTLNYTVLYMSNIFQLKKYKKKEDKEFMCTKQNLDAQV